PPRSPLFPYTTLFRSPVGWADWLDHLESLGISRNVLIGRGEPASIALWFSFQVWARERRGEQLAELLTQGAATIEEIQAIARGRDRKSTRLNSSHVKI